MQRGSLFHLAVVTLRGARAFAVFVAMFALIGPSLAIARTEPAMARAVELIRRLPDSSVLVAFTPAGETFMGEVERLIPAGNVAEALVGDRTLGAWAALARKLGWEKRDAMLRLMGGVSVLVVYQSTPDSPDLSWALFLEATPETARQLHSVLDAYPRQVVGRSPIFSVEDGAFLLSTGQLRAINGADNAGAVEGGRGRFVVLVPGDDAPPARPQNAPARASADDRIAAMCAVLTGDSPRALRSTRAGEVLRDASLHAGVLMRGDRVPVIPPMIPGGAARGRTWDELGLISLSAHAGVLKIEAMAQSERFNAVLGGLPLMRTDLMDDVERRLAADAAQVSVRLPGDAQRVLAPPPMLPAMLPDLLPATREPIGHVSTRLVWMRGDAQAEGRVSAMGVAQSLGEAKRAIPSIDGQVSAWVAKLERGVRGPGSQDALAGMATLEPRMLREVAITIGSQMQGVRAGASLLRYRPDHAGWSVVDLGPADAPGTAPDTLRSLGEVVTTMQPSTAKIAARRTVLRGFAGASMVPMLLNGAMLADPSSAVIWRHLRRSEWEVWLDDAGRLRALVELRFAEREPGR